MVAPRRRSDTHRPLLDEEEAEDNLIIDNDDTGRIALEDPDDEPKPSGPWIRALNMAPTTRDRWSLGLLAVSGRGREVEVAQRPTARRSAVECRG